MKIYENLYIHSYMQFLNYILANVRHKGRNVALYITKTEDSK